MEVYKTSEAMFQRQKALASEIAALKPIPGSLPEDWEDPSLLASNTPAETGGTASKGYHDATKGLDSALLKWSSSIQ